MTKNGWFSAEENTPKHFVLVSTVNAQYTFNKLKVTVKYCKHCNICAFIIFH